MALRRNFWTQIEAANSRMPAFFAANYGKAGFRKEHTAAILYPSQPAGCGNSAPVIRPRNAGPLLLRPAVSD